MSIRLKDGGPVFPATEANGLNSGWDGMNLRQYYAAHAPAEIPDWFEFTPATPRPAMPDKFTELTDEQRNQLEGLGDWLEETQVDLEVVEFARRLQKAREETKAWHLAKESGRYIAWRWHYADMMLSGGAGFTAGATIDRVRDDLAAALRDAREVVRQVSNDMRVPSMAHAAAKTLASIDRALAAAGAGA
jgi:hypothetical protein